MSRLLIVAPDAEGFREHISRAVPDLEIFIALDGDLSTAKALAREADCMLAWKFPPGLLDDAPRLRWIQSFGAGVDHLMSADIPEQVTITRVYGVFSAAMAEYVLGYCLAVTLQMRQAFKQQQRAEWKQYMFPLLRGRTAVVVGLGSIGREVCRTLTAAGLRVLGVSRSGRPIEEAERTYAVENLDEALPEAEFLVIVVPLTPATRGLIGAPQLGLLPRGAWLMNIARGPIAVEDDVLAALRSGQLGGAALDVFEQEPLPPDHPFWGMENVIVTPHVAGPDDTAAVAAKFVENYRRYHDGLPLLLVVDRQRGY